MIDAVEKYKNVGDASPSLDLQSSQGEKVIQMQPLVIMLTYVVQRKEQSENTWKKRGQFNNDTLSEF